MDLSGLAGETCAMLCACWCSQAGGSIGNKPLNWVLELESSEELWYMGVGLVPPGCPQEVPGIIRDRALSLAEGCSLSLCLLISFYSLYLPKFLCL